MLRQITPRNARSKRALEKREPKAVENPKVALFLRGTSCSQVILDAMADLYAMRQPLAKKFTKKNAIHPFEDASSLEFFSLKNDTSLLVFGSSSKKRPHTLTLIRTFGSSVLDMMELHLDATTHRTMQQFKTRKFLVGLKPLIIFSGSVFESADETAGNEWTLARSMLLDFFSGEEMSKVDVESLQWVVAISAEEPASGSAASAQADPANKPTIRIRAYMLDTKRSGQKLPRIDLEEIGPRMDFRVGRIRPANDAMWKEAMRRAKATDERPKKNISTAPMGDKLGRLHLGRQDLTNLQTRKMKGLKRSQADGEGLADVDGKSPPGPDAKRRRNGRETTDAE